VKIKVGLGNLGFKVQTRSIIIYGHGVGTSSFGLGGPNISNRPSLFEELCPLTTTRQIHPSDPQILYHSLGVCHDPRSARCSKHCSDMKLTDKDATGAQTPANSTSPRLECNGNRPGPGFRQKSDLMLLTRERSVKEFANE